MAVPSFQDLPLASRGRRWNGDAAEKRVRKLTGAEDGPNAARYYSKLDDSPPWEEK